MIFSQPQNKRWYYVLMILVALIIFLIFRLHEGFSGASFSILFILHALIMTLGLWIGCMMIVEFLWVKFPWEQTPVKHLLLEILLILLYTNLYSFAIYRLEVAFDIISPMDDLFLGVVLTNLITLLITALHEAAEFYKQWKYNFSKSVRLEKDNIEARYEMLKTQINPHFLFNSLNSLSSLVDGNEKAVRYIQNLSDFLRYMLQNRDKQLILLREEITNLKDYVELQLLRFSENLEFNIDVEEKFFHYSIPPLVLQMLVENCLKHNVISKDYPLKITVKADKEWLTVENNLQRKNETASTGQGLKNISERYRYFTTRQVKIKESDSQFSVSIPLLQAEL